MASETINGLMRDIEKVLSSDTSCGYVGGTIVLTSNLGNTLEITTPGHDTLEGIKKERDAARRSFCEALASGYRAVGEQKSWEVFAAQQGWSYLSEEGEEEIHDEG